MALHQFVVERVGDSGILERSGFLGRRLVQLVVEAERLSEPPFDEVEFDDFKNVPIIMFSAMDSVEDKIEGFELGVDDYITKPFNFSEVLARIRAVLRNKALARQVSRKERRIAVIESLNKSLIFFTQHIRKPISRLLEMAEDTNAGADKDVKKLVDLPRETRREIAWYVPADSVDKAAVVFVFKDKFGKTLGCDFAEWVIQGLFV